MGCWGKTSQVTGGNGLNSSFNMLFKLFCLLVSFCYVQSISTTLHGKLGQSFTLIENTYLSRIPQMFNTVKMNSTPIAPVKNTNVVPWVVKWWNSSFTSLLPMPAKTPFRAQNALLVSLSWCKADSIYSNGSHHIMDSYINLEPLDSLSL